MNITIGIIIVDYHTVLHTINYINEQLVLNTVSNKIVIVLNDVLQTEVDQITSALDCEVINGQKQIDLQKNIYVILSPENLGYAKGNNLGAKFLVDFFEVDFLCICNNDLNFRGENPFVKLISKLEEKLDVGAIGPKIIGLENENQSPHKFVSIFDKYLFRNILTPFINLFSKTSRYSAVVDNAQEGYYYRLMGCFIVLRTKSFIECGMFDEGTFLFGEEAILSERLLRISQKCYFVPDVCIVHEHGKTISKFFKKRKRLEQEFITDKYYYIKYLGVSEFSVMLAKICFYIFISLNYFKDNIKSTSKK
ncbi:hypothetical protein VB776_16640 [Arcicella sp. DC2W]|uniref:Glycosyltransferase 2-like domain-containing protein n=1 Tax=Arcicella gelida TaxID=2984195 RepID=A0ABU5S7W3_9BACT|nr:hypothetical protein [Arcicella sp. DC2W]MEA5404562.1 hypothetical protein [Arcicella sp. DC2W]